MKHILNNLSNEEKNSIREQHTGGMRVVTENFHKLLGSKLGDVKPLVSEQSTNVAKNVGGSTAYGATTGAALGSVVPGAGTVGGAVGGVVGALIASADAIANGIGTSDQKVKQFCDLCKKSKVQITQKSNRLADMVRDAVQGSGTNEDNIYKAFNSLASFDEFCSLVKAYQQSYGSDLYVDLDDDIDSEGEWVLIFRPIRNLLLRQQQQPTSIPKKPKPNLTFDAQGNIIGTKPTNPTFGAKPTTGVKPTNPTFGAKPTTGVKPTNPTFGAKPTAVPTKQPKFTSE